MWNTLKPLTGPVILAFVPIAISMPSELWQGIVWGVVVFWGMLALLGNRALVKKCPGLIKWLPFLGSVQRYEPPESLGGTYLVNRTIRIADLAEDNRIVGRTFEKCVFVGPAVLYAIKDNHITQCRWDGPEAFIFVPKTQKKVNGPIGLEHCSFRECVFNGIGLITTEDHRDRLESVGPGERFDL